MVDASTDYFFADDVDEMPDPSSRRLVTPWTLAFAALLVGGLGFVAGIQMEKRQASSAVAVTFPGGFVPDLSGAPGGAPMRGTGPAPAVTPRSARSSSSTGTTCTSRPRTAPR